MSQQEPVFYRDAIAKLKGIFSKHCNLSGEQYQEIEKRLVFMVATIQDGYPIEDTEQDAEELSIIFDFLHQTNELTLEEYNDLCNFVNGMVDEAKMIAMMEPEKSMEWTECAKRLPEESGLYLAVISGLHGMRRREIIHFTKNISKRVNSLPDEKRPGWFIRGFEGNYEVKGVTHWMELPALPEE